MRTPGALAIAVLAIGGVLTGCAGSGGGGGGGGTPKPACKPPATPSVSFSMDIQPIFNRSCALVSCHSGAVPAQAQDLTAGAAYRQLVNVASTEQPRLKRVKPGEPNNSYLVRKIEGGPNISGVLMPNGCPSSPASGAQCLTADEIAAIVQWVTECAPNN
ncbi:MAG TPA: hypothetical protein VMR79_08640 [Verrucomicrobiae bacterium]|nr:hypothetical protein [Verrucomicrobiae bacterium]